MIKMLSSIALAVALCTSPLALGKDARNTDPVAVGTKMPPFKPGSKK